MKDLYNNINQINHWMKKYILIVLIFSFLLQVSCVTDETCTQTKYVKLTTGFYHVVYNDLTKTNTFSTLSIDSLTVQGMKIDTLTGQYQLVDSILYNNQKNVSTIDLPLNSLLLKSNPSKNFSTQTTFKIKFNATVDTMTVYHTNLNDYLSLECGCIVTHSIDTVIMTNHFIDSVKIKIHDVNTINAENISLYK